MKAKHLDGLQIKLGADSKGKIGSFERKRKNYSIYSKNALPPSSFVTAEEMKSFRLLLPRRTQGSELFAGMSNITYTGLRF
jgi:hypothetical protein